MGPLATSILSSTILVVIVLAVHAFIYKIMSRPREWLRALFFALGFGTANFINEFFGITGVTKSAVLVGIALPFFYIGQYFQKRMNRPAA